MWCRATDVRSPTSSGSAWSSRSEISATDSTRTRAAASSRASGRPSSCSAIRVTAGVFSDVSAKDGRTAWARSVNRRTACRSGGTGQAISPVRPSASRLVASTFRSGQPFSKVSTRAAQASIRCSQLSRMSSALRLRRTSVRVSVSGCPGRSPTPATEATARGTRSESEIGASSTTQRPLAKMSVSSPATARPSRVFPLPPSP